MTELDRTLVAEPTPSIDAMELRRLEGPLRSLHGEPPLGQVGFVKKEFRRN